MIDEIEVDVLDAAGVRNVVANALEHAGCSWPELRDQARVGCFTSPAAHRAWFVVSSFVDRPDSSRPL